VSLHLLVAVALSTLIGVSLGLLGGGGSILAVPLFVYVAGVDAHAAIGMSLAVVGATSLVGTFVHARARRVDVRAAVLFGALGMVGAPIGAHASHAVSGRTLLLLFAALMIGVGGFMLAGRPPVAPRATPRLGRLAVPGAGFAVGLLTGFLGVGGGFLVVPALTLLARLPMHTAVGTSLLVIALNSAAGLLGHLGAGALSPGLTGAFTAASVVGAVLGVRLSGSLDARQLRRGFAGFVVAVGLALLVANLGGPGR